MIDHQIEMLQRCGIDDIVVVTGYQEEKIREAVGNKARFINYEEYHSTNNLFTLWHIKEELNDDFVCLFSDVLFGEDLLRKCLDDKRDFSLLVHNKEILADTMRVKISNGSINDIGSHVPVNEGDGNFIGVAKFSKKAAGLLVEQMEKLIQDQHRQDYYTISLVGLAAAGHEIGPVFVDDNHWIEIDHKHDYERAVNEVFPLIR